MQEVVESNFAPPGEESSVGGALHIVNEAAFPSTDALDCLGEPLGESESERIDIIQEANEGESSSDDLKMHANARHEVAQSTSDDSLGFATTEPSVLLSDEQHVENDAAKNDCLIKDTDQPSETDEVEEKKASATNMHESHIAWNDIANSKETPIPIEAQPVDSIDESTQVRSDTFFVTSEVKPVRNENENERSAQEINDSAVSLEDHGVAPSDNELAIAQTLLTNQQDDSILQYNRVVLKEISELKAMYNEMADQIQNFQQIQSNVEQQMNAKAEAENETRITKEKAERLEEERGKLQQRVDELESIRDQGMKAAMEAEERAKDALEQNEKLEKQLIECDARQHEMEEQILHACQEADAQRHEVQKLREERDELVKKEMSLTSRLNAAKMKESDKSNLADHYEGEINAVEHELKTAKTSLLHMNAEKLKLEQELDKLKSLSSERVTHAEHALEEERRLNEERKKKMKVFVENKAEELRQAKEHSDALQIEVNQTNRSLLELNNRWKQLQAQYVQSQSRNRELQMDLNRIKKDSENLHKVGDTLEMKLSKSATETEEHKNKRLAAKHELMAVLRSLETERKMTARLRDTIKFTFAPKALSQQKLLQENLDDFEIQLQTLAQRLGKSIPPSAASALDKTETEAGGDTHVTGVFSDADIDRLIAKLEKETQSVSQCIMNFSGNLERMHMILDASGDRTCVSVIAELLMTGGNGSSPALQTGSNGQVRIGARRGYGSLPLSATQD